MKTILNDTLEQVIDVSFEHLLAKIKIVHQIAQRSSEKGQAIVFYFLYTAPIQECNTYSTQIHQGLSGNESAIEFLTDINYFLQSDNYNDLKTKQFFDTAFSGQLCEIPEGDHATKLMIDAMRGPIKQKFFEAVKELDVGQKYLQELDPKFKISDRSSQLGRV